METTVWCYRSCASSQRKLPFRFLFLETQMAQKISKHLTFLSEMWMTRSEYQYSHLLKHTSQGSSSWVYVPNLCDHVVVQTNKAVHILYFRQHRNFSNVGRWRTSLLAFSSSLYCVGSVNNPHSVLLALRTEFASCSGFSLWLEKTYFIFTWSPFMLNPLYKNWENSHVFQHTGF